MYSYDSPVHGTDSLTSPTLMKKKSVHSRVPLCTLSLKHDEVDLVTLTEVVSVDSSRLIN